MKFGMPALALTVMAWAGPLEEARNRQDLAALERIAQERAAAAKDAASQHGAAEAYAFAAEVALELRDKQKARALAEAGIRFAEQAVAAKPDSAEYHRVLGTLCGQVIPANVLAGLRYGKRAREALDRAVQLEPGNPKVLLSRGVGYYYLPEALGGGPALALAQFEQAAQRDPRSDEAFLWMGLTLRKLNRFADARRAFERSLQLNPARVWTRQQLDKTAAP